MVLTFSWTSVEFWVIGVLLFLNLLRWRPINLIFDNREIKRELEEIKSRLDDIQDEIPHRPQEEPEDY